QEDLNGGDKPAPPPGVNRLVTVKKENSRPRGILDGFFFYAGRIQVGPKTPAPKQLLEEVVGFFSPPPPDFPLQLRLKKYPHQLVALVDPKLIKQCVLNLMINAVQAMGSGGELILTVDQPLSYQAVIDVIDTGSGIPAEKLPRIFDAYYTTKRGG